MNSFLHSHPSPSPRQRRRGIAVAVFVGLVFIPMGLKAQIPELTSPDVLPESPAAAQIAKYIDCPVDLGNGLVQIEIPLFVIVDGDIRIPLTLSYHASGLKPNMRSSCWLGDGWSLSTGPSLSRSIAGGADEWFYNSTIAEAESPTWYQLSQVVSQAADATLDEYHYALLSGSGRMYIRNPDRTTRKAVTIPDDPVLVEFPSSQDWSSTIVMTDRTGQDSATHLVERATAVTEFPTLSEGPTMKSGHPGKSGKFVPPPPEDLSGSAIPPRRKRLSARGGRTP